MTKGGLRWQLVDGLVLLSMHSCTLTSDPVAAHQPASAARGPRGGGLWRQGQVRDSLEKWLKGSLCLDLV